MANELEKTTETNTNPETQKTETKETAKNTESEARIKQLESEIEKLRKAQTNASADASEWKKKYQATLSEQDKAKEQQEEQNAALHKELEELRNERNVANYTGTLTAPDIGMDVETAKAVAAAINGNNPEEIFNGIRKFIASHDKELRENAFRTNPTLPGGKTPQEVTKEQFEKMGYTERLEVFEKYPDLYKEFTK